MGFWGWSISFAYSGASGLEFGGSGLSSFLAAVSPQAGRGWVSFWRFSRDARPVINYKHMDDGISFEDCLGAPRYAGSRNSLRAEGGRYILAGRVERGQHVLFCRWGPAVR